MGFNPSFVVNNKHKAYVVGFLHWYTDGLRFLQVTGDTLDLSGFIVGMFGAADAECLFE